MAVFDFVKKQNSKKIVIGEIDVPLTITLVWTNYKAGIWVTKIVLGDALVPDDRGNYGYYGSRNTIQYRISSVTINGVLQSQVSLLSDLDTTEKAWFYDPVTTNLYITTEDFNAAYSQAVIKAGGALGFTDNVDRAASNYFDDQFFSPRMISIPSISKKKDSIFFGKLQFSNNSITLDNTDGYFDDFSERDLYGQPARIKLLFEGDLFEEALIVYTGRVDKFRHDFSRFTIDLLDPRKLIARKLPINYFDSVTYPGISSEDEGAPIPIIFGPVNKVPAYRVASGLWVFADTSVYPIDSGITVYREDGTIFSHSGTGVDGTFSGTDTTDKLLVDCAQTTVVNGLDVISSTTEEYNNVTFSEANYDLTEWNSEKTNIKNVSLWIGKGNELSIFQIIEQICQDNQGIFDVLSDGRYSFRTFDPNKTPSFEILDFELMSDPQISYDSKEFLSSIKINYGKNYQENEYRIFPDYSYQDEVFERYRQYKERIVTTALSSLSDAQSLSADIMEQSKIIKPILTLSTKIQHIDALILDNAMFTLRRQNGKIIIPSSSYQILGIDINLSSFLMTFTIKFIDNMPYLPQRARKVKLLPTGKIKMLPNGIIKNCIVSE